MKRFLSILMIFILSALPALADPLPLLEDYTEEMAAKHGIIVDGLNETGSNVQYPFGLKSFQDIIEISHTTTY